MEEQPQINTNIINTNKQIDKDDKTISSFFVAEEHNKLTLELIEINYINAEDSQIFYYDDLFKKLLEDNSYRDLMTIIHLLFQELYQINLKMKMVMILKISLDILRMLLKIVYIDLIYLKIYIVKFNCNDDFER